MSSVQQSAALLALLERLGYSNVDRLRQQNMYLRSSLRLDVLHFLFHSYSPSILGALLPFKDVPSECSPTELLRYIQVFCDLALLLGLVDARRYDRSQLQALVEGIPLHLAADFESDRSPVMSAHIGFMDALIGAVRTAHSHRQESEEGNEAGHASLSQSLSPTHAQASAREHASASEDIGPKRSSHSDLISVNEHAEKCNQLAALCAAQSSALFSDDISRLFPPDIPASLNLHRTRLQPAAGAGTGAALRKGAAGANSTAASEWSLLPASRMLPVPPASTIDTLRTQVPLMTGSGGGAKAAGGAVAAMSAMSVEQCNRLLQGALDQCRAQCVALETSLTSLRSSASCLLDVMPAAHSKPSMQQSSVESSAEYSASKSVDQLRVCVPTLHNRIHDFNYRWRTRWAQWALPPNKASSSKSKAKPTRPAAEYRVDDDEYDNESFEDENQQQQQHDNQDDEDETSTGARFNAHRIGATMQRMHLQLAPIQAVWTHVDNIHTQFKLIEPNALAAQVEQLQKPQLSKAVVDRLEQETDTQSLALLRRQQERRIQS